MLQRTGDENNDFFFSEQILDFIKMVAVDGRSKNRIGPRKVFNICNEYYRLDIWDISDKLEIWQCTYQFLGGWEKVQQARSEKSRA